MDLEADALPSDDRRADRIVVVVDGEHYPPVVVAAIGELHAAGHEVVGALLLGGTEKLAAGERPDYGLDGAVVVAGDDRMTAVDAAVERWHPDAFVDLSGSPIVDARSRMRLAARALWRGVSYRGADFRFVPPPRPRLTSKPSVAVIGTAKRSGKTAVAGHFARWLRERGTPPVVVAMGRGGPPEPEIIELDDDLSPAALLELAAQGRHAASDHLEDALMARVPTIGTRRAGGGMAGGTVSTTFGAGVELADARPESFLVFEGSGAAIPPADAGATVCVVPAFADPELVTGYLGTYALLLADLIVITLADQPLIAAAEALEDRIRELVPGTPVVVTTFRPHPLEPISGRSVFFATTAPSDVASSLAAHLEGEHGARVVGWSSNLANRTLLIDDLSRAEPGDVLVTELKAAAVDVATKVALEADMHVVYCDNRPVSSGAGDPIEVHFERVAALAEDRARR